MSREKDNNLISQFEDYIKNNNEEAIRLNLPKLLSSYSKISKRTGKILKQSDSQQLEVLKLKEKLEDTNNKVNTLLNNANQGFLYFGGDMLIGPEYSKKVYFFFNEDVTSKDITQLLYPNDKNDATFLKSTLQSILKDNPMRQEILISLLQKEFEINGKFIELEYKVLNDENFMLILTDITTKKLFDQKIKDEQQILKMVVETVITKEQFMEVKKDYESFIEDIDSYKFLEKLADLRREIHTYKGLFAQKEMLNIVKKLHNFETIIDQSTKTNQIADEILNITKDEMYSWLELDLSIMKDILGDDYFSKSQYIEISKYRIDQLHKKINDYINSKSNTSLQEISDDIEDLKYKNIKIFFRPYEKLVEQLALQLDKYINPLVTNIENIYIPDHYIPFINSLVHIFRNSVDHGIEVLDTRYEKEKPEYGTIRCDVNQCSDNLIFKISDDGAGIDVEKIKSIAVSKKLYTQEAIKDISDDEAVMIIFKDTFTTNEEVTTISGRGVGLASIVSELNKLNGKMEVKNNFGFGIEFIFTVPFKKSI